MYKLNLKFHLVRYKYLKLFIHFVTDKQININSCQDDKLINRVINLGHQTVPYVKNNLKHMKKTSDK